MRGCYFVGPQNMDYSFLDLYWGPLLHGNYHLLKKKFPNRIPVRRGLGVHGARRGSKDAYEWTRLFKRFRERILHRAQQHPSQKLELLHDYSLNRSRQRYSLLCFWVHDTPPWGVGHVVG